MKLKSILFTSLLLSSSWSHANTIEPVTCTQHNADTIMIDNEQLYLVVNNQLIRNPDYWQNFLDGNIKLCTSKVTDMSELFAKHEYFNQDISQWNTSRVTNMNGMFKGAKRFNQDLSSWNVLRVTTHQHFAKDSALTPESLPLFNH